MALEDKVKRLAKKRAKAIDSLTQQMFKLIGEGEDQLYKDVLKKYLLKELTLTEDGKLTTTTANYSSTFKLDDIFKKAVTAGLGPKLVNQIQEGTKELNTLSVRYFNLFSPDTVKNLSKAIESRILASYGLGGKKLKPESPLAAATSSTEPLNKIKGLIHAAIATGAKIADLEASLKATVVDDGLLKRYLDNSAVTNIYDRYDRQTTNEYSKALKLNFAIYQGGVIEDSRDFCIERNGKVFSREEIERFGTPKDKFGGYTNKSAGEFQGKFKPSTKIYDPITDLGGYNCRHHLDWISDELAFSLRPELEGGKS